MFYVYILKLSNGKYYIGQTNNLASRLIRHQTGQVRSTKGRPVVLAYFEEVATRSASLLREKQLKSFKSHSYLQQLIESSKNRTA